MASSETAELTLEDQVRGTNPNTGAQGGLVEQVAADEVTANLALALRRMTVGSFQSVNADLRSVEASCKAAVELRQLFNDAGLDFKVLPPPKEEVVPDNTPKADSGRK